MIVILKTKDFIMNFWVPFYEKKGKKATRKINSVKRHEIGGVTIYNLNMHINIYDLFSTIIRLIWFHNFNHIFDSVPCNSTVVLKKIYSEFI
jgi:5-methylthioribose kinase